MNDCQTTTENSNRTLRRCDDQSCDDDRPGAEPVTSFTANTPKLFALFETTGIKNGDKVRGVLVAEDVGDVMPANTELF